MKKKSTFNYFSLSIFFTLFCLIILLIGIIEYMMIASAQHKAKLTTQIIKESLTAHMISGSSDYQQNYLKRLKGIEGIKEIWVVRSPLVVKQYGNAFYPQEPKDELDLWVLRNGERVGEMRGGILRNKIYRYSIPYTVTTGEKVDCISCHNAKVGDTLGVVSVETEINDFKTIGFIASTGLVLVFGLFMIYFINKVTSLIRSYKESLNAITLNMKQAEIGEYEHRISPNKNEDGYEAIMWSNAVLEKFDSVVSQSCNKIKTLVRLERSYTDPLYVLQSSIDQLYDIEHFRSAIELDQTIEEVYGRLATLLRTRWNVHNFNLFEYHPIDKSSYLIHTERGVLCDVLTGCGTNGSVIDSRINESVCLKMIDSKVHYICKNFSIVDDLDIIVSIVTYDEKELIKFENILDQLSDYVRASRLQIVNKKYRLIR